MNTQSQIILQGLTREDLLADIAALVRSEIRSIPKPEKEKPYLTLPEVVELTGLSKSSIYQYTFSRQIPFLKRSGKLLFDRSKIVQWLEESAHDVLK